MENSNTNRIVSFVGGAKGEWDIVQIRKITGETIPTTKSLSVHKERLSIAEEQEATWVLKGFASNLRYTTRPEKNSLDEKPSVLGKPENNYAAMIPIKKSDAWWLMTQDERRHILEEDSHHIRIGSKYLSSINRQLFHSRDLGEVFDFVTWFEFLPENESQLDELLNALRNTEEWKYVVREVDIRLVKP